MSEETKKELNTEKILSGFASMLSTHSGKIDEAIEKLTDTVQKLTESHIETKKDREHDSDRMERIEDNQKEQGQKIETISDTVLLLDERVGNQKDKWSEVGKIAGAIVTAVLIAKFIPI